MEKTSEVCGEEEGTNNIPSSVSPTPPTNTQTSLPLSIPNIGTKLVNMPDSVLSKSLATSLLSAPLSVNQGISNEEGTVKDREKIVTAVTQVEDLLLRTLDRSKHDRQFLLENEDRLVTLFHRSVVSSSIDFPPLLPFQRKLVHLLCQRFRVSREILVPSSSSSSSPSSSSGTKLPSHSFSSSDLLVLRIYRLPQSSIPSVLLRDIVHYVESLKTKKDEFVPVRPLLLRSSSSSSSSSVKGDNFLSSGSRVPFFTPPLPRSSPSSSSSVPFPPPPLPPSYPPLSSPPPLPPDTPSSSIATTTMNYMINPKHPQQQVYPHHHHQPSSSGNPSPVPGIIHITKPTPQGTVMNHIIIPSSSSTPPNTSGTPLSNNHLHNNNNNNHNHPHHPNNSNNGHYFSSPPPTVTPVVPPLPSINTNVPVSMVSSPHYISNASVPSHSNSLKIMENYPASHYIKDQWGNLIPVLSSSPSLPSNVTVSSVYSPVSASSSTHPNPVYHHPYSTNTYVTNTHENSVPIHSSSYPSVTMYAGPVPPPPSTMTISSNYSYAIPSSLKPMEPSPQPVVRYVNKDTWIQPIHSFIDDSLPPSPSISTITPTKQHPSERAFISGENISANNSPTLPTDVPILSEDQQQVAAIRGHISLSENGSVVADEPTNEKHSTITNTVAKDGNESSQSTVTLPTNIESISNNNHNPFSSPSVTSSSSSIINVPYHVNNTGVNFVPVYNSNTNTNSNYGTGNENVPLASLAPDYLANLEARVWQATVQATMETLNSIVQQSTYGGVPSMGSYSSGSYPSPAMMGTSTAVYAVPSSSPMNIVPSHTMVNTVPYTSSVSSNPLWYPPPPPPSNG